MISIPSPEKVGAVVPAAGRGERLPGEVAKQFRPLGGVPMLARTLSCLAGEGVAGSIVVVLPESEVESFEPPGGLGLEVRAVAGGARRQDSVANGVAALPGGAEWVIVHDGARPFLPAGLLGACLAGAQESGACIAATPAADTVKRADSEGFSAETLPRGEVWLAQTPQVARRDLLERALKEAAAGGREGTDEAALLEAAGVRVKLVLGAKSNFKITTLDDLALAEAFLAREGAGELASPMPGASPLPGRAV
jgi:2-C-methyl-D-erythritol 4-phosphate cytidylyltransferase